jgi:hypothetical protein
VDGPADVSGRHDVRNPDRHAGVAAQTAALAGQ